MIRLFVALQIPDDVRQRLVALQGGVPGARWANSDQMHLTLRFIGEVDRPVADDLASALGSVRAGCFPARINGVGRFEQRNSGALWAGVEPKEPLAALAAKVERVCQSVGLEPERRAYHPHITLARWKGRRSREVVSYLERHRGLVSEPWEVDRFILFESRLSRHGAHYEEVVSYALT